MAGPARKTPFIFGASLTPTGNIAVYGSKAAGSPAYSDDPQDIQSAAWLMGQAVSLAAGQAPYFQDDNGKMFTLTSFIFYLLSRGLPEWDSNVSAPGVSLTQYNQGDICRRGPGTSGPNLLIWVCQANNIRSDPVSDPTNWKPLAETLTGRNLIKSFVVFDATSISGGLCEIINAYNVTSVEYLSTGTYRVNFATPMPVDGSANGIYGIAGTAGTRNGANWVPGDNNIVNGGGGPGGVGLKTATQCLIYNWDSNVAGSGALEDSSSISVNFFG